MENKTEVIKYLRALAKSEDISRYGICDRINLQFGCDTEYKIRKIMMDWPKAVPVEKLKYNSRFPVPHPTLSSVEAYFDANDNGTMWSGEYGHNRRELCLWVADELEKNDHE